MFLLLNSISLVIEMKFFRLSISIFFLLQNPIAFGQKNNFDLAFQKSIVYLNQYTVQDTCDYNIAFLAKYLSHQYNRTDFQFDLNNVPIKFEDQIIPANFYGPLIGLKSPLTNDSLVATYQKTVGIEHILLWGIYADRLSLDSNAKIVFFENSMPHANIRNVCHVAIAIYWANNKISRKDKNYLRKFRNKYLTNLKTGLKKNNQVNDDLLECMVGLLYMGKMDLVSKQVVENMIKTQNPDGGWAWDRSLSEKSHPHTTILAYWILLELTK